MTTIARIHSYAQKYAQITMPEQQVTGIPTADLDRVVEHTLDSAAPNIPYYFTTKPEGNGYLIQIKFSSQANENQVRSELQQVLALKWPGVDFQIAFG